MFHTPVSGKNCGLGRLFSFIKNNLLIVSILFVFVALAVWGRMTGETTLSLSDILSIAVGSFLTAVLENKLKNTA